jgi:hypothetical protein
VEEESTWALGASRADEMPDSIELGLRASGPRFVSAACRLAAESEPSDDGAVARVVLLDEVRQKAAALADELEEAAARVVVLGKAAEVIREALDPLREERDLDLRGAGIALCPGVVGHNL